jgi:hypothetical protein
MPELDTITVKGFKGIACAENLNLGPINVIVGPNGSGKSNFIGKYNFVIPSKKAFAGRLRTSSICSPSALVGRFNSSGTIVVGLCLVDPIASRRVCQRNTCGSRSTSPARRRARRRWRGGGSDMSGW